MKKQKIDKSVRDMASRLPFSQHARVVGRELFLKGAVKSIQRVDSEDEYLGVVVDDRTEQPSIFQQNRQWLSQCTCGQMLCRHVAAMALAMESTQLTELLEAGKTGVSYVPDSIESHFSQMLGKPLGRKELRCMAGVRRIKEKVLQSGCVGTWELTNLLGLPYPQGLNTWDSMAVFMPKSRSDFHFWLSLADTLKSAGFKLPEYMHKLSLSEEIEPEIRGWHRSREIKRWETLLSSELTKPALAQMPLLDIRLKLTPDQAGFECRYATESDFSKPTKPALQRLLGAFNTDQLQIVPNATPLWEVLSRLMHLKDKSTLDFQIAEDLRWLGQILRNPSLHDRVVTSLGEPFERPTQEQLLWLVQEPKDEDDDYSLQLAFKNGAHLTPPVQAILGIPPLYITTDSIYEGPDPCVGILKPGTENKIPKEAVETTPGLNLLSRMHVELPAGLRQKVREERLQVFMTCSVVRPSNYSSTQVLLLEIQAGTPESGMLESFVGNSWQPATKRQKPSKAPPGLIRFDRSSLALFPSVLEPIQAVWDYFQNHYRVRITKKFPELFAAWLAGLPRDVEVRLPADLQGLDEVPVQATVKLDCSPVDIDWFDLKVTVDVNDTLLTADEIKLLLDARGKFVNLPEKGWKRMHFNISEAEDEQIARLGLSPRDLSSAPQRMHTLQLADPSAESLLPQNTIDQIRERKKELQARVVPAFPKSIKAELRPYQLEGFHFLAYLSTNRFGGILADDMGLGKTLQTLTWLVWLKQSTPDEKRPSLVVCPKSVAHNWQGEAARFCPELKVLVFAGGESEAFATSAIDQDIVVINYAQLRSLATAVPRVDWLAAILDEGQFIKNPQSQTASIARTLRASHRLVLTGTPIENRLLDLWSLMAFAMPGVLGNQQQFVKTFASNEDPWARKRLSARTRPFLIRRTKGQVAKDLPDRIEEDIFCELEGEQLALYRAEFKYAQQLLLNVKTTNDLDQFRFHFLASLMRLRQICCHPALVKEDDDQGESAKLSALVDLLEPILEEGNKVLVFSQFVKLLHLVSKELTSRTWHHFMLTGQTENRGKLIEDFHSREGASVFLLSLKAGGFGLNMTAASYVVLFDPWWNPAVENQAIDRTHRIGQLNKVIAYRLLAKNTIEEKIRLMQRSKKALAEDVLGEEKFAGSLSLEDLHYLFSNEQP